MTNADACKLLAQASRIRCGGCYRKLKPFKCSGEGRDFTISVRCPCKPGLRYGIAATTTDIEDARPLWAWPEDMQPDRRALIDRHGRHAQMPTREEIR